MATIAPIVSNEAGPAGNMRQVTWTLGSGDVGAPVKLDKFSVVTVQLSGTVTAVAIEGSNDLVPTTYASLRDSNQASLAALAAAGFVSPCDQPLWLRPNVTTGTAVLVSAVLRRRDISGPTS